MPLYMIREDITRMNVDAIVDPTDRWYSGSGGSDLAIHTAAGPELEADVTEEELRNAVRDTINRLAPGGGYCWSGMIMGLRGDERTAWKNGIIQDEAKKLCADFYK